jgi:hypothetical protein
VEWGQLLKEVLNHYADSLPRKVQIITEHCSTTLKVSRFVRIHSPRLSEGQGTKADVGFSRSGVIEHVLAYHRGISIRVRRMSGDGEREAFPRAWKSG